MVDRLPNKYSCCYRLDVWENEQATRCKCFVKTKPRSELNRPYRYVWVYVCVYGNEFSARDLSRQKDLFLIDHLNLRIIYKYRSDGANGLGIGYLWNIYIFARPNTIRRGYALCVCCLWMEVEEADVRQEKRSLIAYTQHYLLCHLNYWYTTKSDSIRQPNNTHIVYITHIYLLKVR